MIKKKKKIQMIKKKKKTSNDQKMTVEPAPTQIYFTAFVACLVRLPAKFCIDYYKMILAKNNFNNMLLFLQKFDD
jgi:hypothetical protein